MEPFMGQVQIFGFNFPPRSWATCSGQVMSISQNSALFSLLGTVYGGNGQTTFGLPDLRARAPVGAGAGAPGLQSFTIGEMSGAQTHTLITTEMPMHIHTTTTTASTNTDGTTVPTQGSHLASLNGVSKGGLYSSTAGTTVELAGGNSGVAGGSQPFNILNPFLAVNYCIALEGIFPSRN